jgi:hypothetical protein
MTEQATKMYYGTIDLGKSLKWAIFQGSTQPTDYNQAIYEDVFFGATSTNPPAINITPGTFSAINRGDSSLVQLFFNENAIVVIPASLDLTGLDIRFVVEDANRTDVLSIPNGSITRTSTSFSVLIPDTVTNTLQDLVWALRMTADDKLLLKGAISISYAAD